MDRQAAYRKGLIASVKIAQKDLGMEDEDYRALLRAVTGKDSAAKCSVRELKAMLAELRLKGWRPRPRIAAELLPLHRKIKALLASLGRPRTYAETIIKRQTNNSATLGTADRAQLMACVAALTCQQRREAQEA